MVIPRRKKYRAWNPEAYAHQPLSPADRLPEDDLVFFLLDVVPQLDLDAFYESYELETRGQPPFDPTMLVCLLLYSYCVGVYSSRKIAQACERNLAFLAIVGDDRPDFRTISDFRKEHLELLAALFVQVLKLAAQAGMVRLGNLAFDGSKFTGQASRHKAMSYGYMLKEEERLKAEIEAAAKTGRKDRRRGGCPPRFSPRRRIARGVEASGRPLGGHRRRQAAAWRSRRGPPPRRNGNVALRKRQSGSVPAGSGGEKSRHRPAGCPRTMSSAALAIRT